MNSITKSDSQKDMAAEGSLQFTPQSAGSPASKTSHAPTSTTLMNVNSKVSNIATPTPIAVIPIQFRRNSDQGIPIFTDEFLEHNKTIDLELRMLRKSNIDYEQQNSMLEKHIENMRAGVDKMNTENAELEKKNALIEAYLDRLKNKLITSFVSLPLPSEPDGTSEENFGKYMTDLPDMATSNSHGPTCLNKAKDIVRKLDFPIQM